MPRGTAPEKPEKVVFVPLDSRPVSTRLPASLAKLCGWNFVLPPEKMLGGLHKQADSAGILDWLTRKALKDAKKLIISTDLLCYGGLVFSRDKKTDLNCAITLIDNLKFVKQVCPKLRIIAFRS